MKVKIEWVIQSGSSIIEVSEEDGLAMLDKKNPASPPCDFDDLPKQVREDLMVKISDSIFDGPVEIESVEKRP